MATIRISFNSCIDFDSDDEYLGFSDEHGETISANEWLELSKDEQKEYRPQFDEDEGERGYFRITDIDVVD